MRGRVRVEAPAGQGPVGASAIVSLDDDVYGADQSGCATVSGPLVEGATVYATDASGRLRGHLKVADEAGKLVVRLDEPGALRISVQGHPGGVTAICARAQPSVGMGCDPLGAVYGDGDLHATDIPSGRIELMYQTGGRQTVHEVVLPPGAVVSDAYTPAVEGPAM